MQLSKILDTRDSKTIIIIRLMVGAVFLSEGIQKFLFPSILGAGRFENIGIPFPDFMGGFVGFFEILCGILILMGLFTRLAAIPTLLIMVVAIVSTKFTVLEIEGFWSMLHGSRTDWPMLLGSVFLIIKGGGKWSIDRTMVLHFRKEKVIGFEAKTTNSKHK